MATQTKSSDDSLSVQDTGLAVSLRTADRDINAFVEVFDGSEATIDTTAPLSGLSFAVKEIIEQTGKISPWGVDFLQDRIGVETAPCVAQLEKAGACRVGTTRSTLMAIVGESGTRNPRDLTRSPGGSSAGSAAVVAAGMVDVALGTQTVGSVIRPASYCGVVGFKPTFGKIPTTGIMPLASELDHVGIFTRDIGTARTVMNALGCLETAAKKVTQVLVPEIWFGETVHHGARAAVDQARRALQEHGLEVTPFRVPDAICQNEADVLDGLLCKGIYDNHSDFIRTNATRLPDELVAFEKKGALISAIEHAALRGRQHDMQMLFAELIPENTALLCPSVQDLPPLIGQGTGARQPQRLWTLLGVPCLGVPVCAYGGDFDHLSVSVQLIGRHAEDASLLDLGALLEGSVANSRRR